MEKLRIGDIMPDFQYDTPFRKGCRFSQKIRNGKKTALIFLRYYGCTLCQFDMARLRRIYPLIKENGGELIVGLQSNPDLLASELGSSDVFPFDLLCDPDQTLYRRLYIDVAENREAMAGENTMDKISRARAEGFQHGAYEGEELQLPAVFITDNKGRLCYVRYGKTVDDIPSPEELAELVK